MNGNVRNEVGRPCQKPKSGLVQLGEPVAPQYWRSVEERDRGIAQAGEFPGGLGASSNPAPHPDDTRRDFLSLMGFTMAAAGLAACRAPVQHAIPLVTGSDQIVPGVSSWYATTCGGCESACGLLVKQRDGRAIKIEGNDRSALFGGGTCATGQATVLSLYDNERLRGPLWKGQPVDWPQMDRIVTDALAAAQEKGRRVVLLSKTITSPSTQEIIAGLSKRYSNFRHVMYDAVSLSALREANAESFNRRTLPHYAFDKARVIVGLEADFLGTWLSPVEFARQYARTRNPEGNPSLHIQFESGLCVTGSNADIRIPVAPSEIGAVVVALLCRIAQRAGAEGPSECMDPVDPQKLDATAAQLWAHRGESLVVSGVQDKSVQIAINALNTMLGNVGKTLDMKCPSTQRGGNDLEMAELVHDMQSGQVHTLLLYGVNPAYDYSDAKGFLDGLQKVDLSVSFSGKKDETSTYVQALCPSHHFLESWGDAEPVESSFSLSQPLIAPLFDTRAADESLLRWQGDQSNHYTYLREFWRKNLFPRQTEIHNFDAFWDQSLQDGVRTFEPKPETEAVAFHGDWKSASNGILASYKKSLAARASNAYELHLYESVAMRDGRHANNPWLQELPDPITKITWGNFAAIAPKLAKTLGLNDGDVVALKTERGEIELPVFTQPGQHERTISVALGHGRTHAGKAAHGTGANAFPLVSVSDGFRRYSATGLELRKTGRKEELATTQTHFSMEGRPLVLETSFTELKAESKGAEAEALPSLWTERLQGEHSWGMMIDMNTCTGCSACVVACQAENNVPVVGKDQVQRIRIMHWIRIDRYYTGSEDNPASVHQPMMCQHCGHAPCETVCPVVATTTSSEGINQQVYNRCIGTRYCANNCPYKVRRFNWYNYTDNKRFDYNMANPLGRMVLNPDVVVRSRGVMEKCSLCVQRIQLAKNIALQQRREVADGDIKTACQQSCPTQAIVFGDLKDPHSQISLLRQNRRQYQVLEELGTRPNIGYLKKVRNTEI